MNRKMAIDLTLQKGKCEVMGVEVTPKLPNGCIGLCFVYESKTAAINNGCVRKNLQEVSMQTKGND